MTIEFYYGRKHQAVMEEAGAVDAVKAVVDYCTEHYGKLSYGTGDTLKLIQSRVAGGGYAVDGASLLDEADFTIANLGDTNKGAVPGETFIHELVHQWWGLGNMFDTVDSTSPWSAEGLTVYTTYRIVKELYGEDYAREHYVDQWQQAVDDYYLNFYVRHPEYLEMLPENEQLAISNSLSQVRQYSEMPLKILKGRAAGGRRGGHGPDPPRPVQPGTGSHVPLSDLPGIFGCLPSDGGGFEPWVRFFDTSAADCCGTSFLLDWLLCCFYMGRLYCMP